MFGKIPSSDVDVNLLDITSSNYDLLVRSTYTSSLKTCPSPAEQNHMMSALLLSALAILHYSQRRLRASLMNGKPILFKEFPYHLKGRFFLVVSCLPSR
jgi:hypothetical protein